ncbi:hypothetical protein [Kitasatospora sp. NPDC001547]|uniref:hypothetical protein n=1 Tax=Kitasatospora sp. NPDC001547 TaxID=3364015 RepID=UPI00369E3CB0|nr:hypothetical protein KitaXyl93_03080 [Kitasatospora sp. Xyl93]
MAEEHAADDRAAEEWVRKHFGVLPEPQGALTAFDGRLVIDLDTRLVTVDGREVRLTRAEVKLLRGLVELGEGVHGPHTIMWKVFDASPHPHELRYPMTVLRTKLGEPSWIVRTDAGYGLRPPELP